MKLVLLPNGMKVKSSISSYKVSTELFNVLLFGHTCIFLGFLFKTDSFSLDFWHEAFSTE